MQPSGGSVIGMSRAAKGRLLVVPSDFVLQSALATEGHVSCSRPTAGPQRLKPIFPVYGGTTGSRALPVRLHLSVRIQTTKEGRAFIWRSKPGAASLSRQINFRSLPG